MNLTFIIFIFFFLTNSAFAEASGPDFLWVKENNKRFRAKNLGCTPREGIRYCKVLYENKELEVLQSQTSEAPSDLPPSFDCSKSKHEIEHIICKDSELSNLDRHLSNLYRYKLRFLKDQNDINYLKSFQRGWIKGRNECWKSKEKRSCIQQAYQRRIKELKSEK